MVCMHLVRLILSSKIKKLEAEFTYGYQIGTNVFYVSLTNEKGRREDSL
jgi:hypothetical protein